MANISHYFGPAFLVAAGFMDPGNWITLIEGGSRFGYELAWVVLSATLLAMLLQTVSSRLGVITGKHFAQICREELPSAVCSLLWVLCEVSIITLDLTMVLGTAIGLNVVLRIPILPSLFLVAVDSLIFIVILPLLEMKRAIVVTMAVVGVVLLGFLLDNVLTITLPVSLFVGLLPKLRHETLYAAISIVGAIVMPHNFYLHSALVQDESRDIQTLSTVSHYYFLGTLFAFSSVLMVNLAVLSVAVTGFHNAGLVVLTLQDAQALIEQILNNSVCPAVFGLALLCAGQLSALNGSSAGQVISEAFFDFKIHPWQHRILIRGISLVPVAMCVLRYGNEGIYQVLVFSQVLLALHLPFTVAPLIKITSSERIMGTHKNSFFLETLAWLSLGVLSAVNVTLVFDLVFGETEDGASFGGFEYLAGFDWLSEIGGENLQSAVFAIISFGTTLSLGFLVWLIFTPLQLDTQFLARSSWIEDYARQEKEAELAQEALESRLSIQEALVDSSLVQSGVESKESDLALVEGLRLIAIPHNETEVQQLSLEVNADSTASVKFQDVPQLLHLDSCNDFPLPNRISSRSSCSVIGSPVVTFPESTSGILRTKNSLTIVQVPIVDTEAATLKKAEVEADDDELDAWESLEQDDVLADALGVNFNGRIRPMQCDEPESGRNEISFESEGGSGSGSLSRLSGLGRAARRQFALILDEFWATLFDLHGQPFPTRAQGCSTGSRAGLPDCTLDGSDCQKPSSKQQKSSWQNANNIGDHICNMNVYALQAHSQLAASTSSQLSQSHEYRISPSYKSERRYSSMHMPVYHEDYDYQPATIHGYRTPSFPGRTGSNRPFHLKVPLSGSQTSLDHLDRGNTEIGSLQGECCNPFDSGQPLLSSQWVNNVVGGKSLMDTKASDRHLAQTEKNLGEPEISSYESCQWDALVYRSKDFSLGRWNPLVYRATGELDMNNSRPGKSHELNRRANFGHSPIGRVGQGDHVERAPLVFDELSPSQSHRDAFSIQTSTSRPETQSLWSRQPFEQLFGATDSDGLTSHAGRLSRSSSRLVQSSLSDPMLSGNVKIELEVLEKLQMCLGKLLRLDGADWLFRTDNGADEDLITAMAVAQKTAMEAETNGCQDYHLPENNDRSHARRATNDSILYRRQHISVPNCGKDCLWDSSLLVSFGVWCVHRVLELSFMESRPELWGKYTYVLNRLQGILEPAFSKPRFVPVFCRCFNDPFLLDISKRRISLNRQGTRDTGNIDFGSSSIHSYAHSWPWGGNTSFATGKGLNATVLLDMIKEVETAVGSRRGRTGTAAGDVAFPKGKENLASVLKRYKRRLSSKSTGSMGLGSGGCRV